MPNAYAELESLLDVTRVIAPEEMAELQLEQGYVERALRIYEELAEREPANAGYAMRREWLRRMVASPASGSSSSGDAAPARTLGGVGPIARARLPGTVVRRPIVPVP